MFMVTGIMVLVCALFPGLAVAFGLDWLRIAGTEVLFLLGATGMFGLWKRVSGLGREIAGYGGGGGVMSTVTGIMALVCALFPGLAVILGLSWLSIVVGQVLFLFGAILVLVLWNWFAGLERGIAGHRAGVGVMSRFTDIVLLVCVLFPGLAVVSGLDWSSIAIVETLFLVGWYFAELGTRRAGTGKGIGMLSMVVCIMLLACVLFPGVSLFIDVEWLRLAVAEGLFILGAMLALGILGVEVAFRDGELKLPEVNLRDDLSY